MTTFQNPAVNNTLPDHPAMTTAKDGAGWFSVRPPTGNPQEGQEGYAATVFRSGNSLSLFTNQKEQPFHNQGVNRLQAPRAFGFFICFIGTMCCIY